MSENAGLTPEKKKKQFKSEDDDNPLDSVEPRNPIFDRHWQWMAMAVSARGR